MHLASIYLETIWYLSCSNKSNIFHAITRARSGAVGRSENRGEHNLPAPGWNRVNWSATIGGRGGGDCPFAPSSYGPEEGMLCWLGNDHWQNGKPQFFFLWLIFLFSLDFSVKSRQEDATARFAAKTKFERESSFTADDFLPPNFTIIALVSTNFRCVLGCFRLECCQITSHPNLISYRKAFSSYPFWQEF